MKHYVYFDKMIKSVRIMITKEKINRINELAKKAKSVGLTVEEAEERALLRREYIDAFKADLRSKLERIEFVDESHDHDDRLN